MKNHYTAIACVNQAGYIGNQGKLLYNIKADMTNFKLMTIGNVVIMGRKTFESLPHQKPLKNRINIIVTRNVDYKIPYIETWTKEELNSTFLVNSLEETDKLCSTYFADKELFIIGGSQIYDEAYKKEMINKAVITMVSSSTEGDATFPNLYDDPNYRLCFKTTSLRDHLQDIYYKYQIFKRKN